MTCGAVLGVAQVECERRATTTRCGVPLCARHAADVDEAMR